MTRLEEIKRRLEEATPGPWMTRFWMGPLEWPDGMKATIFGHGPVHEYKEDGNTLAIKDSVLIANAPADLLYLLARLERAEGALEFYGNKENWDDDLFGMGKRARAYFEEFK